jgi:hypothetical protein
VLKKNHTKEGYLHEREEIFMLRNNYKILFCFLLLPFYFNLIILLIAFQVGSLEWGLWSIDIVTNFIGAWLLSSKKNILYNAIGFLCFLLKGGYWFSRLFIESMRTSGLWIYEVWIGVFILAIGFIGFVYVILSRVHSKNINL